MKKPADQMKSIKKKERRSKNKIREAEKVYFFLGIVRERRGGKPGEKNV